MAIAIGVTACSVTRLGFESISGLTPKQIEILYNYAIDNDFMKLE